MRWFPRYSLSTLMLLVLLIGSGGLLWLNRDPWVAGTPIPQGNDAIAFACFSSGGKRVLTYDGTMIRLSDALSGELVFEYPRKLLSGEHLALTPYGAMTDSPYVPGEPIPLQPDEAALKASLNRKITTSLVGTPLPEVLKQVEALTDAKIESSMAVSASGPNVHLRVTDMTCDVYLHWVAKLAECVVDYSEGRIVLKTEEEFAKEHSSGVALRNAENNAVRAFFSSYGGLVSPETGFCGGGRYFYRNDWTSRFLLYEIKTGRVVLQLNCRTMPQLHDIAVSENGRYMAARTEETNENVTEYIIVLWDLKDGKRVRVFKVPSSFPGPIEAPVLSPDGKYLFAWNSLWNTEADSSASIDLSATAPHSPVFDPAGRRMLAHLPGSDVIDVISGNAAWRCNVAMFDCKTGNIVTKLFSSSGKLAYSPDGSLLLEAGYGASIALRDPDTGEYLLSLPMPARHYFWEKKLDDDNPFLEAIKDHPANRISPDGKSILAGDKPVTLWHRRRPAYWWGFAWLWQSWLVLTFAGLFVWSIVRDRRIISRGR